MFVSNVNSCCMNVVVLSEWGWRMIPLYKWILFYNTGNAVSNKRDRRQVGRITFQIIRSLWEHHHPIHSPKQAEYRWHLQSPVITASILNVLCGFRKIKVSVDGFKLHYLYFHGLANLFTLNSSEFSFHLIYTGIVIKSVIKK